jgi:integrase
MARTKLTARLIETLRKQATAEQRDVFRWDTEPRGFGVKITAQGYVSWLVQKWVGGRDGGAKRIVIGHMSSAMPLEKARSEAAIVIGDVHKSGIAAIVSQKQQLREQAREALRAMKLGEAVETYFKRRSEPGRFWSELRTRFNNEIVPVLGKDTAVASIVKADIRRMIDAKEDKFPVAARTMFEALRPFFKWCVERDIIPTSPIADMKAPPLQKSRDRVLTDDELRDLWNATVDFRIYGDFYRLLLLTGQRREEVGGMRWSELDLNEGLWTIPGERTKNGKAHVVHLSPLAVSILRGLDASRDTVFRISGNYSRGKALLDARMSASTKPWRVHDLRRTAASGMARLGCQPHIVERVLNHVSGAQGGLVGVYQRYEYLDERQRALHSWGEYVETVASGAEKASNVVSFTP